MHQNTSAKKSTHIEMLYTNSQNAKEDPSKSSKISAKQKKYVASSPRRGTRTSEKRTWCSSLAFDFERFHIFGSLVSWCRTKDPTFFFLQLLITMALYLFFLFILALLVYNDQLVWIQAKSWTVVVSIVLLLLITLITMLIISYFILSRRSIAEIYKVKRENDQSVSARSNVYYEKNIERDLEALDFLEKSKKCDIFDLIAILMLMFFFVCAIVACTRVWFMSNDQALWVLRSFGIAILSDLFILRPLAIIIIRLINSTYSKAVGPSGSQLESQIRQELEQNAGLTPENSNSNRRLQSECMSLEEDQEGIDIKEFKSMQAKHSYLTRVGLGDKDGTAKNLVDVRIFTDEDGYKVVEGNMQTFAVENNDPKSKGLLVQAASMNFDNFSKNKQLIRPRL